MPAQKSLLSRVLEFLFGETEEDPSNCRSNQTNRRRNQRKNEHYERTEGNQNKRANTNRGPHRQETERTADGLQGGRRRRRRRNKNRSDNPEGMENGVQTPQIHEISPEREAELKAHEEDLTPRPKRATRKQRGEDAIVSQEAQLEAHATTSGEITINDAPVLNEGLMSESEKPKRSRRGRRGSRRNEADVSTEVIAEETSARITQPTAEDEAPEAEATVDAATSDVSKEDKPQGTRRGRGRPRKSEVAADDTAVGSSASAENTTEDQPERAPVTEATN